MRERPAEVSDVFSYSYEEANEKYHFTPRQQIVASHIMNCRTAEMGAYVYRCEDCGHEYQISRKSEFAGPYFECMKSPYPGRNGHIAMRTENLTQAIKELEEKGFSFKMDTAQYFDNGLIKNIYLEGEYGGFVIHIMEK